MIDRQKMQRLVGVFNTAVVEGALVEITPSKSPGPDRFPPAFFSIFSQKLVTILQLLYLAFSTVVVQYKSLTRPLFA